MTLALALTGWAVAIVAIVYAVKLRRSRRRAWAREDRYYDQIQKLEREQRETVR